MEFFTRFIAESLTRAADELEGLPLVQAQSFQEFQRLVEQRNSRKHSVLLHMRRGESGLYTGSSSFSSWTGDQGDKVSYIENYLGSFSMNMLEYRLYLTVAQRALKLKHDLRRYKPDVKVLIHDQAPMPSTIFIQERDLLAVASHAVDIGYGPLVVDTRQNA